MSALDTDEPIVVIQRDSKLVLLAVKCANEYEAIELYDKMVRDSAEGQLILKFGD